MCILASVPKPTKRACLEEVHYICPVPACLNQDGSLVLEIHHINGENDDHRFENLIALCQVCHAAANAKTQGFRKNDMSYLKKMLSKSMQPPTDKFLQILAQGRYRLHDRYSAKGENAWSPLLQGIGLFEFNLKALHLNDRQRAEALDKLVYFKRTYAAHEREHFLDGAMRDLKKWKRLCVAMPDMIGDVLYDEDYIRYLRKGDPRPGLLTAAASETRNPTKKAHICVVQHSIPMIATGDPSRFNEDKYRRDAGVLEGLDPTLYQNYVQHLARKYFLEKKYDKLLKTLELYSQLNDDPNIQTEEQSAPCFFRALILLEDKKFEEAEKLLSRTIAIRKQYGISEGMSEILAYHGRALEEMGETEKAIEVYKKGRKMGFFMANKYGYDLCLKNLGRLLK